MNGLKFKITECEEDQDAFYIMHNKIVFWEAQTKQTMTTTDAGVC